MAIDIHSKANRSTYVGRQADTGWIEAVRRIVDPRGKCVADIGCGGGIYSLAWREIGAGDVVGIDFSEEMVAAFGRTRQLHVGRGSILDDQPYQGLFLRVLSEIADRRSSAPANGCGRT